MIELYVHIVYICIESGELATIFTISGDNQIHGSCFVVDYSNAIPQRNYVIPRV